MFSHQSFIMVAIAALAGCSQLEGIGQPPSLTPVNGSAEQTAMLTPGLPVVRSPTSEAGSLWAGDRTSLLGDRRAGLQGDILTVVIEINERAEFSNSSSRSRSSSESLSIPGLFGIPQRINSNLPDGASLDNAISLDSSGNASGNGSISRSERLELRVAATIVGVMPNGIFAIQGSQEVRVNSELREQLVSGFVRPADISRQNEITYDKIASARISYAGRGQISQVQQPRLGTQVLDAIAPF